jgi:hypothetical protein
MKIDASGVDCAARNSLGVIGSPKAVAEKLVESRGNLVNRLSPVAHGFRWNLRRLFRTRVNPSST